jgi:hypothetical protein
MNPNKNPSPSQSTHSGATANSPGVPYFNAFTVEEYETSAGKSGKRWTKVGVAFPHKDGTGFNIELRALPLDGRLVLLLPQEGEDTDGRETAAPRNPARR